MSPRVVVSGRALLTIVVVMLSLTGCAQMSYLMQSVQGHLQLMSSREPIEQVIDDPNTSPQLVERLRERLN